MAKVSKAVVNKAKAAIRSSQDADERVVLFIRIPKSLRDRIKEIADVKGKNLNQLCLEMLDRYAARISEAEAAERLAKEKAANVVVDSPGPAPL
jgi:uncharacterized protein (DUF1778 family)